MHKILVVVDMQNDFITGALGNEDCKKVVSKVVDVIRTGDYDEVYLTRDTHSDDYLNTQEGRKLPVVHTQVDTQGWQIHTDVMKAVNDTYESGKIHMINKPSFGSMELLNDIKNLAKDYAADGLQVDFAGVCTGICVISNVLPAKMAAPEAIVRVIAHACACVSPESHRTAIEAMRTCQVDIVE